MNPHDYSKRGQAGVYQVAAQLLLRGINISFPAVDEGADLIAESGIRIQVKSTGIVHRSGANFDNGAYWFHFTRMTRASHVARLRGNKTPLTQKFSERCDVVILWGIDQNRFWIVPAIELDNWHMVAIGTATTYRKPVDPAVVKALRDTVARQQDAADELGVSRATISRKLSGLNLKTSKVSIVASYEDRWDVIAAQVAAYKQVDPDIEDPHNLRGETIRERAERTGRPV
jgi:hypothetical protein